MKILSIATLLTFFSVGNVMADGHGNSLEQDPAVQADIDSFQNEMKRLFPEIEDFTKGAYAVDEDLKAQFESIMEMPPFEDFLDRGEKLWNEPFANGKTFASCFDMPVNKIRTYYPRWNEETGKVVTLEQEINNCRSANNEKKWGYKKGNIAYVSAFLTTAAEGEIINVVVPKGNKEALKAYEDGKKFYYSKRGQLNMSCADCHVYNSGKMVRGDLLSPALGQLSHFPVWRGKWARSGGDGFGTIQRRYGGCNTQVRAKAFKTQGEEYSNLEFFHTAMSNGTPITGTEYRR